jgi:diguanylate cyclase (GGDEF)-like protein
MLLNNTGLAGARRVAERLRRQLAARHHGCAGWDEPITVSIGVAELARDEDESGLFGRADSALYEAKTSGRDRVCVAPAPPVRQAAPRAAG